MATSLSKERLEKAYADDLEKAITLIFEVAAYECSLTWEDLAKRAGLHYSTVYKLGTYETKFPQWRTFWKLARACGCDVSFVTTKTRQIVEPKKFRIAG